MYQLASSLNAATVSLPINRNRSLSITSIDRVISVRLNGSLYFNPAMDEPLTVGWPLNDAGLTVSNSDRRDASPVLLVIIYASGNRLQMQLALAG